MNPIATSIDRQLTFNTVATHLLTQMERAQTKEGCRYRAPNGLKCAVGCLITDEEYDYGMEGRGWSSLLIAFPGLKSRIGRHGRLLTRLQTIHDGEQVTRWADCLRRTASEHALDPAIIDKYLVTPFFARSEENPEAHL